MTEITGEKFNKLLAVSGEISGYKVLSDGLSFIILPDLNEIYIKNCTFIGDSIKVKSNPFNLEQSIYFSDVNFYNENRLTFDNCTFKNLIFTQVHLKCIIEVNTPNIESLRLERLTANSSFVMDGNIKSVFITMSTFSNIIICDKLYSFEFSIYKCSLEGLTIINSKIERYTNLKNKFLRQINASADHFYRSVELGSFYFAENVIGQNVELRSCNITKNLELRKNKTSEKALSIRFENCEIKGKLKFTENHLSKLIFKDIEVQNDAHFDDLKVDSIYFSDLIFHKNTYIDNLTINKLEECERKTLRQIKYSIQKTDNKIDYNRFRAYELAAYYRELKWYGDFIDKFVLGATILSTGYNHSWRRALLFTIGFGLFWYSTLYFLQHHGHFSIYELNNYFNGAFRFFLVTDFSSPFEEKGKYLQTAWLWIPLILGKIFIAFGIYEMIQAFRKFKA